MRGPHERYRTGPEVWVVGRALTSESRVYGKPNFQASFQPSWTLHRRRFVSSIWRPGSHLRTGTRALMLRVSSFALSVLSRALCPNACSDRPVQRTLNSREHLRFNTTSDSKTAV